MTDTFICDITLTWLLIVANAVCNSVESLAGQRIAISWQAFMRKIPHILNGLRSFHKNKMPRKMAHKIQQSKSLNSNFKTAPHLGLKFQGVSSLHSNKWNESVKNCIWKSGCIRNWLIHFSLVLHIFLQTQILNIRPIAELQVLVYWLHSTHVLLL